MQKFTSTITQKYKIQNFKKTQCKLNAKTNNIF